MDRFALLHIARQKGLGQIVFDILFHGSSQWTGAKLYIVTILNQKLLGLIAYIKLEFPVTQSVGDLGQFQFHDLAHAVLAQRTKDHHLGKAIQKLGLEDLLGLICYLVLDFLEVIFGIADGKSHGNVSLKDLGSYVRSHDENSVPKIHFATQTVS